MGRTGMIGRGLLGKWGPNHAADPIVTRSAKLVKLENLTITHCFADGKKMSLGQKCFVMENLF